MIQDQFIVVEVSKNWPEQPESPYRGMPLAQIFEAALIRNLERGYELHSWRLNRINDSLGNLNETIIAVFKRVADDRAN